MNEEKILCPDCGRENAPDAKFCSNCGLPLSPTEDTLINTQTSGEFHETESYTNASETVTDGEYIADEKPITDNGQAFTAQSEVDNPSEKPIDNTLALSSIKKVCGGLLSFIFTILLTFVVSVTIAYYHSVPIIISMVPMIILTIACWIILLSTKIKSTSTIGFTMISGVMIFYIVITIIAFLACAGTCAYFLYYSDSRTLPVIITTLVIITLICFLIYLYFRRIRKTATSARAVIQGNSDSWFSSSYVRFILWVSLIGNVLSVAIIYTVRFALPIDLISAYINTYLVQVNPQITLNIQEGLLAAYDELFSIPIILDSIVGILITLFAVLILRKIKKTQEVEQKDL